MLKVSCLGLLLCLFSFEFSMASGAALNKFRTDMCNLSQERKFLDKRLENQCTGLCFFGCNCIEPEAVKYNKYFILSENIKTSIRTYLKSLPPSENEEINLNRSFVQVESVKYGRLVDEKGYNLRLLLTGLEIAMKKKL